jgi:hypothetical protein
VGIDDPVRTSRRVSGQIGITVQVEVFPVLELEFKMVVARMQAGSREKVLASQLHAAGWSLRRVAQRLGRSPQTLLNWRRSNFQTQKQTRKTDREKGQKAEFLKYAEKKFSEYAFSLYPDGELTISKLLSQYRGHSPPTVHQARRWVRSDGYAWTRPITRLVPNIGDTQKRYEWVVERLTSNELSADFWSTVAWIDHARMTQSLRRHHFHAADSVRGHYRKAGSSQRLRRRPVKQRVFENSSKRYTFVAEAASPGADGQPAAKVFALDATPAKVVQKMKNGRKKHVVPNFKSKHLVHVFERILKCTDKRVWVCDNEKTHVTDHVAEWAARNGVRLLFLPPRSPDLMVHDDHVIAATRRNLQARLRLLGQEREQWSLEIWRRNFKQSVGVTAAGAGKWIQGMVPRLERLLSDPQIGGGTCEDAFGILES